ncbi:hypothetical protein ACPXCE_11845 [Streptomyces sp. DT24]|uniref:hypothetical protein n=1 Tax=Streptomyces sp. DT24 TaxID=3416520 RepID=UPI003CF1D65F
MAVLVVAVGLLCGPGIASAGSARPPMSAAASGPVPGPVAVPAAGPDTAVAVADDGADDRRVPGCREGTKRQGGEPVVPTRARGAHDQAPGLAEWGLAPTAGQAPVEPPVPLRPAGPEPAAPTPVELSVLRV